MATAPDVTPNVFVPTASTRVCDSRAGSGNVPGCGILTANTVRTLNLSAMPGFPAGATAAAVNITTLNPSAGAYVTAWAGDQVRPATTVLNTPPGENVATSTVVSLASTTGGISLMLSTGTANVIVDVEGYFLPDTPDAEPAGATRYVPVPPTRLLQTNSGLHNNGSTAPLDVSDTIDVQVAGASDSDGNLVTPPNTPTRKVCAATVGVQAYAQGADGFLTARPAGSTPMPSSVNFTAPVARANTITTTLSPLGTLQIVNNSGDTSHAVVDLTGYYTPVAGGSCS